MYFRVTLVNIYFYIYELYKKKVGIGLRSDFSKPGSDQNRI